MFSIVAKKTAEHEKEVTLFSFNEFRLVIVKVWLKQTTRSSASIVKAHVAEVSEKNTFFQNKELKYKKGVNVSV